MSHYCMNDGTITIGCVFGNMKPAYILVINI